ncbi:MAG: hypothetical protein LC791_15020 [Acidobacteria bacterium]|nr:hypothetical protein [Acidobacteriota bacterium]
MILRYLLHTNIVSTPISKTPDPAILERLEKHGLECAIAAPVWHELSYVAAIARVHQLTLVTTNTRDFTRFTGLTVENWSKRKPRPSPKTEER